MDLRLFQHDRNTNETSNRSLKMFVHMLIGKLQLKMISLREEYFIKDLYKIQDLVSILVTWTEWILTISCMTVNNQ